MTGRFSLSYLCFKHLGENESVTKEMETQNRLLSKEKDSYVVSVIGEDQVGLVAEVTQLLFKKA